MSVEIVEHDQNKRCAQNRVFVLDKNKQPLMPCTPTRARLLLKKQKAAVFRMQPFTIVLKDREGGDKQPLRLSIDPGSKTTGMCISAFFQSGLTVLWAAELIHRGQRIVDNLLSRKAVRRSRRNRKTRYRQARFLNRTKSKGWLAPSLLSRVNNIKHWSCKLSKWVGFDKLDIEDVKFDMQKMQNPEISGIEYQQGTLFGYEVREYLLEKFNRTCVYCKTKMFLYKSNMCLPKAKGVAIVSRTW